MNAAERRKKLHTYIADLDNKKVQEMLTLFEDEVVYQVKTTYSAKDKKEIRDRQRNRLEGKARTYPLAEARKLFRGKK